MTLPEVITALVIMGIMGAAVTGVFISQSQLHDSQEKIGSARAVSRGAVNVLMGDLRMLETTSAVQSASATSIVVRAPFAFGMVCTTPTSGMIVARIPGDTMLYNAARNSSYVGYAWLDRANRVYTFVGGSGSAGVPSTISAYETACTGARMRLLPLAEGGGAFPLTPVTVVAPGTPVMLLHEVEYSFQSSVEVPGFLGLFRRLGSAAPVEIAAPFAATARFRFFANDAPQASDVVPSTLSNITGIEIVLDGVNERPSADGTFPSVPYRTSVFFRNRI